MSVPPSDADLATQACAGSEAASRALVARYAAPAVNLVYRMVRDRGLAEDLAQEAFLRAFQRLHTYDPRRRFSAWFFQLLHNVAIDHLRVRRLDTSSLDQMAESGFEAVAESSAASSPEHVAARSEIAGAMAEALKRLRPEYREIVVLRYQEELTHAEIAEVTGLPVGTVKTNLHRARHELAALLKPFRAVTRRATEGQT